LPDLIDRSYAVTGFTGADYWIHQRSLLLDFARSNRRVRPFDFAQGESFSIPADASKGFHLALPSR